MSSAQAGADRDWESVLNRLEHDVCAAERLVAGEEPGSVGSWEPPQKVTPLSGDLIDRTRELVARQQAALERLEAMRLAVRRHLQLVEVDAAKGLASGPHFFDAHA